MNAFGPIIKEWRAIRRYSQLALAMEADISARHLSFLESGRANPSKAMVLRLSQALKMPRPVTNQALNAAGFAAVFPDIDSEAADLAPVRSATEMMLAAHAPYPGVAVDRHWNIIASNKSGDMLTALTGMQDSPNLMEILLASADGGLIENWEEVAILSLTRLRSEIAEFGGDNMLSDFAARIAEHRRLKSANIADIDLNQVVIPTHIRIGDVRLSLFSTIAQFGSVQDVRASEIRIELMFPADETTRVWFAGAGV